MFIVFDGIDGAGKSTQIKLIENWLEKNNIAFLKIREPGGCPNAEKIRKVFINNKMESLSQLLLISAARFENMQLIKNENRLIICDRFIDSTYAYQGMLIDENIINDIVIKTVERYPDYVFLFLNSYEEKKENYFDEITNQKKECLIKNFKKRIKKNYILVPNDTIKKQHEFIVSTFKKILFNICVH